MQNKVIKNEENGNGKNTQHSDSLIKEKRGYYQSGVISLGRIMNLLEDIVTKSVTKEEYKHNVGFLQVLAKDEWVKRINEIIPRSDQTTIMELQEELTSLLLPLTFEGLREILSDDYNINDETITVFWNLIQQYLIKDGKLYIPKF